MLMLLTSALPCCVIAEGRGICVAQEQKDNCGGNEDKSCGDCGQFSSCALCMGFLLPADPGLEMEGTYQPEREKSFLKIACDVKTAENMIWQPPRFGQEKL